MHADAKPIINETTKIGRTKGESLNTGYKIYLAIVKNKQSKKEFLGNIYLPPDKCLSHRRLIIKLSVIDLKNFALCSFVNGNLPLKRFLKQMKLPQEILVTQALQSTSVT